MSYDLKRFKVLGITRDFNQCECCGKENLIKTVSILDLESGVTLHFGTTCAAKADKYDTLDAFKLAKKEIQSAVREYESKVLFAQQMAGRILKNKYGIVKGLPIGTWNINCPESEWDELSKLTIAWYTNPENRLKPYPSEFVVTRRAA